VHHDDSSVSVLDLLQVKEIAIHGPKAASQKGDRGRVTAADIRAFHSATPFRPFTIHMDDGRTFRIVQPHYLSQHPRGQVVVIFLGGESFTFVNASQIAEVTA
jgi:hypothetical protein